MSRRALLGLFAATALALAGCGGSNISQADARACNTLHELGPVAVAGEPRAIYALAQEFDDTRGDGLSENLEAQAIRVGSSAFLKHTGAPSNLPQFANQMREVCTTLGWKAP